MKHSARLLLRAPAFTIAALAALGLGIAANTAIFSVVNTVLLKPFAYRDPQRIVMFQNTAHGVRFGSTSPTEFNWWRLQTRAFQDISAYDFGVANWTGESSPEQVPIMHVSSDFFRLCGVNAIAGRTFTAADDLPHAFKTAVLAYAFWQRRFGSDRAIIGRVITLNGEGYEVIGVLGAGLENGQITERSTLSGDIEIHQPPAVYLPIQIDPDSKSHGHSFNVAGRLRPGVTLAAANQQLQASYRGYARLWPDDDDPARGFAVQSLQDAITGGVRKSLLMLLGAVGLVLLIACANVANLLLARAAGRTREIAIRAAVGASRARLVRQLLTESLMLSLTGGALGLAAGYAALRAILTLLPGNLPRLGPEGVNVTLDWRVLGFTLAVSILTGIVFGLAPALQASRVDLNRALKESTGRGGTGLKHQRARSLLVTAEMALAVVLLIGAALLIRSFVAVRSVNPGFDARNILTMRMSLAGPRFGNPAYMAQVVHEGLRRIRELPGVEAAAATCCLPMEDRLQLAFHIAGRPEGPASLGVADWTLASAGYFETFQIPLLRGRRFTDRDESGPPVVLINQALAKQFWPDRDPLRDQVVFGGDPARRQIVGVVGNVRDDFLNRDPHPAFYLPSVTDSGTQAWVIRTRVAPLSLSAAVQNELREATGGLPVAEIRTMEQILARSTATESFNTVVLAIFGGAALLLAAIGIYGLMAYSVAQRTQEIGIRVALGAAAQDIRTLVVFQGLRPAAAGMICGLVAAMALTRLLTSFLFAVKPWDPLVFSVVPVVLGAVAMGAVWFPALRAGRVNPIDALHDE